MKKKIKVILCLVIVLAVVVSIVASVGFNKSNGDKGKSVSVSKNNSSKDKGKDNSSSALKNNKNVKDVKKVENGSSITVTINGQDSASVIELKALALDTANDLKKANPDKKINVKAEIKNQEVENVNLGNDSNKDKIYFETKPMYDPILKCIRFKLHNVDNVTKVQVLLDGKELKVSNDQILKTKTDVFAVKDISENFKTGKIILQDKSGNKLEGDF